MSGGRPGCRVVVIVQARMASTRLPGKILRSLCGAPMLERQIRRLQGMRTAAEVMVATSGGSADDPVAELCRTLATRCFRGSEEDVLLRFLGAAQAAEADVVVRSTADCPLVDPDVTDRVVAALLDTADASCDYASNIHPRTFPRGLDIEALHLDALHLDALARTHRFARSRPAREHVTWFLYAERPDLFLRCGVVDAVDRSALRWTVDTPADFDLVTRIYEGMDLAKTLTPYPAIAAYVEAHPGLSALNAGIAQKNPEVCQ